MSRHGSLRAGKPSAASVCAAVVLALLFTVGCSYGWVNSATLDDEPLAQAADDEPKAQAAVEDETVPVFDYRLDADRLAEVLGAACSATGLVAEPLRRLTGLGDAELANLLQDLDEEAAAAVIALALAMVADADDGRTQGVYCVSYTESDWRPNAERRIHTTGVFGVDVADWRNVKEDRPSTATEVMNHFEFEYAEWLMPRYEGVFVHKTHCRLLDSRLLATAALARDAADFRELGHRVMATDWTP